METVTKQLVTNSSLRTFKTCRKQYEYRYQIGLRPVEDSFALKYGTAFHRAVELLETEGLEAAITYLLGTGWSDPYAPHTLAAQIRAYAEHWWNKPFISETLHAEETFAIDLINPESGRASQGFDLAGKIDAIVRLADGRLAIRETKTMSEDPGNNSRYWNRLLIDPQITLYFIAAKRLGFEVETVAYDVIRKPCMKPALATAPEARKYTKEGKVYANQREFDETPAEWQERLYADMMERPDFYLNRKEIPRLDQDLDEFHSDTWDAVKDLRHAQLSRRWYRTVTKNCDQCPYFGFCTGMKIYEPGTVPEGFEIVDDIHGELQR